MKTKLSLEELLAIVVDALEDVKGQDIKVFNTHDKTSAFSRAVVCSGTSNRQTRALASSVARAVKTAGGVVNGMEGTDSGEWVLVDCGEVTVHCMQPQMRAYYNLEELWGPHTIEVTKKLREQSAHAPAAQ